MQKTADAWFTGGTAASEGTSNESRPSLLADWNSYAATCSDASSSPPSTSMFSSAPPTTPSPSPSARATGEALMYFGPFLASGIFFVFIAFTLSLPVMVIMPQKFAISFTLGCALIIASLCAQGASEPVRSHDFQREPNGKYAVCIK